MRPKHYRTNPYTYSGGTRIPDLPSTPDPASTDDDATWRVILDIESADSAGVHRSQRLDLPRESWTLGELHELARGAASAASVLSEDTTSISVRVSFPGA